MGGNYIPFFVFLNKNKGYYFMFILFIFYSYFFYGFVDSNLESINSFMNDPATVSSEFPSFLLPVSFFVFLILLVYLILTYLFKADKRNMEGGKFYKSNNMEKLQFDGYRMRFVSRERIIFELRQNSFFGGRVCAIFYETYFDVYFSSLDFEQYDYTEIKSVEYGINSVNIFLDKYDESGMRLPVSSDEDLERIKSILGRKVLKENS